MLGRTTFTLLREVELDTPEEGVNSEFSPAERSCVDFVDDAEDAEDADEVDCAPDNVAVADVAPDVEEDPELVEYELELDALDVSP